MDFELDFEQRQFLDGASRFFREHGAFDAWFRDAQSGSGFDRAVWEEMATLGWLALNVADEHGGLDAPPVYTSVIMEQSGRALSRAPFVSTAVIGALLVRHAPPALQAELAPAIASGAALVALAHAEPQSRFDLASINTRAERSGDGFALTGTKSHVPDGAFADWLIVPARSSGDTASAQGVTLFLVPANASGIERQSVRGPDYRHSARVTLSGVQVDRASVIGEVGHGLPLLRLAVDHAIAAGLAEAVGIMEALRDTTLEYIKTRKQFGVTIGSFQVLQHRMVDMEIACEEARAIMRHAIGHLGHPEPERRRALSAAKTRVGQTSMFVGHQAVQLHGGIGTTDELIVSHYLKRLAMLEISYGNADHHRKLFLQASLQAAA